MLWRLTEKQRNKVWVSKRRIAPLNVRSVSHAAEGGGQKLNGFNHEAGLRNRRYRGDSECHLAPRCPWRDTPRGDGSSLPQQRDRAHRPSYSSISMETPAPAQGAGHTGKAATESECGQPFATTIGMGGLFLVSPEDSVVVLDTGAAANLESFSWLARHHRILEKNGVPRATT